MDQATPNLPSRDFTETSRFYAGLGFEETYRDENWLITARKGVTLEFFPHPALDPATSWFSCCLRLDDVDGFMHACRVAGIEKKTRGFPRIHMPEVQSDFRMGALIDPDGTLLRIIENGS